MCIGATVCLDLCMRHCMRAPSQSSNASAECKESVEAHNRPFFAVPKHHPSPIRAIRAGVTMGPNLSQVVHLESVVPRMEARESSVQQLLPASSSSSLQHTGRGHGAPIIPTQTGSLPALPHKPTCGSRDPKPPWYQSVPVRDGHRPPLPWHRN